MTKYLFSFPSSAMVIPKEDFQAVSDDAHAVIEEAKAAGVYPALQSPASYSLAQVLTQVKEQMARTGSKD
jgi:hypothetical protein